MRGSKKHSGKIILGVPYIAFLTVVSMEVVVHQAIVGELVGWIKASCVVR